MFTSIYDESIKNGNSVKENQDDKSIWFKNASFSEDDTHIVETEYLEGYVAVFDGHGQKNGKIVSSFVKTYMHNYIVESWDLINSDFHNTINILFRTVSIELRKHLLEIEKSRNHKVREVNVIAPEGKNYNYIEYCNDITLCWTLIGGGTTISLQFFLENGESYHVHLGDSECVLFEKFTAIQETEVVQPCQKTVKRFTLLTKNHSPDSLEEYERIQNSRGDNAGLLYYDECSLTKTQPVIFNNGEKRDPNRIYASGIKLYHKNVEGDWATLFCDKKCKSRLAMTRSMGDYYLLHAGLSHEPTIIKTDLSKTTSLLLASDGLWDNWKKADLMNLYFKLEEQGKTDKDLFDNLMENTTKLAKENFGRSRDDITAIMIIF